MSTAEIQRVERALARTSARIEEMADYWAKNHMPCCPSCAFGSAYTTLCDKAERQAAWLVVLLNRRGGPRDEARVRRLRLDYIEAEKMARHLEALEARKKASYVK